MTDVNVTDNVIIQPDDPWATLVSTFQDYKIGHALEDDVRQAIVDAVDGGYDVIAVANLVNTLPARSGRAWLNPVYGPDSFPTRTDEPVQTDGGLKDQDIVFTNPDPFSDPNLNINP